MRSARIIAALALILGASAAFAQASADVELKKLLTDFLAAASHSPVSAEDKKMFDRFFADNVLYTRSAGATTTKTEIMKSLDEPADPKAPKVSYSAEEIVGHQYGDTAIVAFRLVQRIDGDGKTEVRRYRNTATFLKRGGRWQAVAWQATRIPEEPAK